MTAKKTRQISELQHVFQIPLEEVLALLPATARESLAGWDMHCYTDTADGGDGEDDVLLCTFSQRRVFEPDASGKMAEKSKDPLDRCARKGEVQQMIAAAIVADKAKPPEPEE